MLVRLYLDAVPVEEGVKCGIYIYLYLPFGPVHGCNLEESDRWLKLIPEEIQYIVTNKAWYRMMK
jgi:hypothetical protein